MTQDDVLDTSAIRPCPRCDSHLFINAGLRILVVDQSFQKTSLGRAGRRYRDFEGHDTVYVCSQCLLPVTHDQGELVDLSSIISTEEVASALLKGGYQVPAGRRQTTKADSSGEEVGVKD